jgi:DNA-binding GntR family transcriptional regulator
MSERLAVAPIGSRETFKDKAYQALRDVIVSSGVYRSRTDIRLDERQLAQDFGILAHAGAARRWPSSSARASCARCRGAASMSVRKTKQEVIEMITAWAALESMAARLITEHASDEDIAGLRRMFADLRGRQAARPARRLFRGQHRPSTRASSSSAATRR